jgi:phenylacetate-CoA ligase
VTVAARVRRQRLRNSLEELRARYDAGEGGTDPRAWQLEHLNALWSGWAQHVPWVRDGVRNGSLPHRFATLEDYAREVPVRTRPQLRQAMDACRDERFGHHWTRVTGGSSGEPIRIPACRQERRATTPHYWLGRSWYGISPADPAFLFWGHAHRMGEGPRRHARHLSRALRDRALGYLRFSVYDLSTENLHAAAEALIAHRPRWVLGLSNALHRFATVAGDAYPSIQELGLRAVVATGENFASPNAAQEVERVFGAPLAMEYGSAETNLIAHGHPEGGYRLFWRNYLLEAAPPATSGGDSGWRRVVLTSLYDRSVPLIRYDIGDLVRTADGPDAPQVLYRFDAVLGRSRPDIELSDGQRVHAGLVGHLVKKVPEVRRHQLVVERDRDLRLLLELDTSTGRPPRAVVAAVSSLLGTHAEALARRATIEVVDEPERTRAGKTPEVLFR